MSSLVVKDLCKTYIVNKRQNNVLRNVNMEIEEGEMVEILNTENYIRKYIEESKYDNEKELRLISKLFFIHYLNKFTVLYVGRNNMSGKEIL